MSIQANKGDTPLPIDFIDLIEAVFVNQGVPKLRKNDKRLMINLNGRLTVWNKHYPIPDIGRPILADQFDGATVPKGHDV